MSDCAKMRSDYEKASLHAKLQAQIYENQMLKQLVRHLIDGGGNRGSDDAVREYVQRRTKNAAAIPREVERKEKRKKVEEQVQEYSQISISCIVFTKHKAYIFGRLESKNQSE
jgi:DNA primase